MKEIDLEHPDYLFNDYTYINNIIGYTIRTENNANSFSQETIYVEVCDEVLQQNSIDYNKPVIFNLDELRGKKYRVTEVSSSAYLDTIMHTCIEAIRVF